MPSLEKILTTRRADLLAPYNSLHFSRRQLILHSVDKSTLRAFRHRDRDGKIQDYKINTPSSLFRTWAQDFLEGLQKHIADAEDFDQLHNMAFYSLRAHWSKHEEGSTPPDYKLYKLIDLFFKFVPRWIELTAAQSKWVYQRSHAPVDKFSLLCYKRYSNNELRVRSNSSMRFAQEVGYHTIQNAFAALASPHPLILFDLLAWEEGHPVVEGDEEQPFELVRHGKG